MDGVISDTQKVHAETECALFREYGVAITPEENTRRFAGVPDNVAFPILFREAGKSLPNLDALITRKWKLMLSLPPGQVKAIPGALGLIQTLHDRKIPLAVASSSS